MSTPEFHVIDRTRWERDIYFDYYYNRIKTKYNINVNIDITRLMEWKERQHLKFFPTMLYVVLRAVNQNKEFRMSFNAQGELGYWEEVVPSYTLFHPQTRTFTDIWSEYHADFPRFYKTVCDDINRYKDVTGCIKARPDQPANFCPVSCLPWLSFTGFARDTYTESTLLFPLITFGKYFRQGTDTLLPFSVFVSHAVADGYHTCCLINDIQHLANHPEEWMSEMLNR